MLKRFYPVLVVSSWLLSLIPAFAVGTIPFSMTQQLDQYGAPLSGCQLYTIQAGTTSTPQNAFKDTALTIPQPNPMVCDSSGRLPQFFLADGQIKIRLLDKLGNLQVVIDNILVIGPSSGGGGGGSIDPTTIFQTGMIMQAYGTQVVPGWVRFNGRTIGSAPSGASERANADTQALFLYLWSTDASLTVSGGRTTAAADYAANKTITLPDGRGRVIAGLDDMGNIAAGRLTAAYFGASGGCGGGLGTTLGQACGGESKSFAQANLPSFNFTVSGTFVGATTSATVVRSSTSSLTSAVGGGSVLALLNGAATVGDVPVGGSITGVAATGGSGTPLPTVQPTILVTIYIKL